jgi:hypothetical protein
MQPSTVQQAGEMFFSKIFPGIGDLPDYIQNPMAGRLCGLQLEGPGATGYNDLNLIHREARHGIVLARLVLFEAGVGDGAQG